LKTKYASVKHKWFSRVAEIARRRLDELKDEMEQISSLIEEIKSRLASIGGVFEFDPGDPYAYEITLEVRRPVPARVHYVKELGGDRYDYAIEFDCSGYSVGQCRDLENAILEEFWNQVDGAVGELLEELERRADKVFEIKDLRKLIAIVEDELMKLGDDW